MNWVSILAAVGGPLAAGVVGLLVWLIRRHIRHIEARAKSAEQAAAKAGNEAKKCRKSHAELTRQHEELRTNAVKIRETAVRFQGVIRRQQAELAKLQSAFKQAVEKHAAGLQNLDELQQTLDEAKQSFEKSQSQSKKLRQQLGGLRKQLARIEQADGLTWDAPMADDSVEFAPRPARPSTIISVLNFKGGVGKTTISANLGATLGAAGRRVLLVDLDYQRSLSIMCLSRDQQREVHESRRSIHHFFLGEDHSPASLLQCREPVRHMPNCDIIAATAGRDEASLEDAEAQLLAQFLIRPEEDVRLRLRAGLHGVESHQYNFVLLDCPPRLSTACINALAASDYVLIPVLLDRTSAEAVPHLLQTLRRLRDGGSLTQLRILGVLGNRTRGADVAKLTAREREVWDWLEQTCRHDPDLYFFPVTVKQAVRFSEAVAAKEHVGPRDVAAFDSELKPAFLQLVKLIDERI